MDESRPLEQRAEMAHYIRYKSYGRAAALPQYPPNAGTQMHRQTIAEFEEWFARQRPLLEAGAAVDARRLSAARAAMDTPVCRASTL